jgi:hypothetical protein
MFSIFTEQFVMDRRGSGKSLRSRDVNSILELDGPFGQKESQTVARRTEVKKKNTVTLSIYLSFTFSFYMISLVLFISVSFYFSLIFLSLLLFICIFLYLFLYNLSVTIFISLSLSIYFSQKNLFCH